MGYATYIKDAKDSLVTTIEGTTTFEDYTYSGYVIKKSGNPQTMVNVERDDVAAIGAKETRHDLTMEVWMQYLGGKNEAALDKVIDYVGEIVDVVEADRDLGSSYVNNTELVNVDFSFSERERGILHTAVITFRILIVRNV